ncbi:MAG: thioredoxin [Kiritimatiellae bacterium]|nr:thioredoxin [Kiritimatiellia bacterium]MCO5067827.1 thioredoxin [Kiritimatiellia bacterium]
MRFAISTLALVALLSIGCSRASSEKATAPSHEAEVIISSTEQFDSAISSKGFVLVDFWATWCPPCKIMNPIIAEIASEQADSLTVLKVDVDENNELAARYKIEAIPTFILFKDGKPVDMKVGAFSKDKALAWLDAHRG